MKDYKISLEEVKAPQFDCAKPIELTKQTMLARKNKILNLMNEYRLDSLVIYGDVEHGSNFEYLIGFIPRFEEALCVIHNTGEMYLILGNENLNKAQYARVDVKGLHAPVFSLPNQPMEGDLDLKELLKKANLKNDSYVGVVGWKLFTSKLQDNKKIFDLPYYVIESLKQITDKIENYTSLFIDSSIGARVINNANEIAHYEFGSALASDSMLKAMDLLDVDVTEMELGQALNNYGQRNSVVTIAATGERFINANLYPIDKKVKLGDKISLTVGYKGGLSSRAGYAVYGKEQLPDNVQNYLDALAIPYFKATVAWLENVHCGMSGGELYQLVDEVLPRKDFNWYLCPGHLTSDEEWLSSPVYKNSTSILKSGMIMQLDIIPSVAPFGGVSAESTVAIADKKLREDIKNEYPEMWARMQSRRKYLQEELNIRLHEDILPMASTLGYLRPYLLDKQKALKVL